MQRPNQTKPQAVVAPGHLTQSRSVHARMNSWGSLGSSSGPPSTGGGSLGNNFDGPLWSSRQTWVSERTLNRGGYENAQVDLEVEGSGLVAISQSPDGQRAVTGGWNILSVINMDGLTPRGGVMSEGSNVLAVCRSHKARDIKDVRWHPGRADMIASASSAPGGGNLAVWNLERFSKPEWQVKDSDRPVWRVAWSPLEGNAPMLLSASLDGTISVYDIRGRKENVLVPQVKGTPRDLRVCSLSPTIIALGLEASDGGSIQIWDMRNPNACLERVKEETAVHAVDWHPQHPTIFASGRAAKNPFAGDVKIWDLKEKTAGGDLAPIGRIFTADGVSNIMWRPGYKYQLATTYMSRITRVDVWDIPCYWTPMAGLCGHKGLVTDLVWQDAHIRDSSARQNSDDCSWILSCSKDGSVQRQHLHNAYLPFVHTPNTSFSQDAEGRVVSTVCTIDRSRDQLRAKSNTYKPMEKGGGFLHSFPLVPTGRPSRKKEEKASTLPRRGSGQMGAEEAAASPMRSEIAVIRHLGLAYLVFGKSTKELCYANQQACRAVGDQDKVAMWSLLGNLFSEGEVSPLGTGDRGRRTEPGGGLLPAVGFSSTPDLVLPLLRKILEHASMQGDVQTAVTLSLILGHKTVEKMEIPKRELVGWIEAYLDLLHQQRLYPAAAKVMMACGGRAVALDEQDALHQIAGRNQRNTSVKARFGRCTSKRVSSIPHTQFQRMSPQKPGSSPQTRSHGFPSQFAQRMDPAARKQSGLPPSSTSGIIPAIAPSAASSRLYRPGSPLFFPAAAPQFPDEPEKPKFECCNPACKAPIKDQHARLCSNCGRDALPCALCRVPVRGQYVWCQGCGHGGHLQHMVSWFSRYEVCPTGCGHRCNMAAAGS